MDAEGRERIDDGADDRRRRADGPGFADAFDAQGVDIGRRLRAIEFKARNHMRARHGVIHQASGDQLPLLVVNDLFVKRLPDRLRDAALNLTFNEHGIDHFAAIIDGDIAQELHVAGLPVDLHNDDVRAEGEGEVLRLEEVCR